MYSQANNTIIGRAGRYLEGTKVSGPGFLLARREVKGSSYEKFYVLMILSQLTDKEKKMFDKAPRDFIYLDWERIRSIAAQLFHGVPEQSTTEKHNEAAVKGEVGGNFFGLLQGKGGADYRYFKSENETRSLHHSIYSLVEDRLTEDGLVEVIDDEYNFAKWNKGHFHDGQFIRVTGLIRLIDFSRSSAVMEELPKILKTIQYYEDYTLKSKGEQLSRKEIEARKEEQKKQLRQLEELKLNEFSGLMKSFYGESIRIKVVPSKEHLDKIFVASANPNDFIDTAASINQKYGFEIDANWVTFGQINKPSESTKPLPIPIGNPVEDSFEGMMLIANNISRMFSVPNFPAIQFTPICIYRICGGPTSLIEKTNPTL